MRVKNFSGFMKTRKLNESSLDGSYAEDGNEYDGQCFFPVSYSKCRQTICTLSKFF